MDDLETQLTAKRAARDDALDALMAGIEQEAKTAEAATGGDATAILPTGLAIAGAPQPVPAVVQPLDLSVTAGDNEGTLDWHGAVGNYHSGPNPDLTEKQTTEHTMANDYDLRTALKKTASALASRELSEREADTLLESFKKTSGTGFERALSALAEATQLPKTAILEKSAASDNTDRTMRDLKDTITNWKPGP